MRIFREFFFVKSTVEERARNSWGRYRMAKVMAISIFDTFEILSVIAMMNPLITMQDAEATKAKINLVEKKPSFGEIGLATPVFRHLASPREAEKQEREYDMRKRGGATMCPSNITSCRLSFPGETQMRVRMRAVGTASRNVS